LLGRQAGGGRPRVVPLGKQMHVVDHLTEISRTVLVEEGRQRLDVEIRQLAVSRIVEQFYVVPVVLRDVIRPERTRALARRSSKWNRMGAPFADGRVSSECQLTAAPAKPLPLVRSRNWLDYAWRVRWSRRQEATQPARRAVNRSVPALPSPRSGQPLISRPPPAKRGSTALAVALASRNERSTVALSPACSNLERSTAPFAATALPTSGQPLLRRAAGWKRALQPLFETGISAFRGGQPLPAYRAAKPRPSAMTCASTAALVRMLER
jgi:hypothetical protein